jgi:hypothetical protein
VARAHRILPRKPQTLVHEDRRRVSLIRHHPKELNRGEASRDQGKPLGLLGAREARVRSSDVVKDRELQAAAASTQWIICSTKSE